MAGRVQQRSFWAAHVRRFDESGLTRRQYCDRHHLAPSTLDYWRRRSRVEPVAAFVPVQARTASVAVAVTPAVCVLRLRVGEVELTVPADVDVAWMASLLQALR